MDNIPKETKRTSRLQRNSEEAHFKNILSSVIKDSLTGMIIAGFGYFLIEHHLNLIISNANFISENIVHLQESIKREEDLKWTYGALLSYDCHMTTQKKILGDLIQKNTPDYITDFASLDAPCAQTEDEKKQLNENIKKANIKQEEIRFISGLLEARQRVDTGNLDRETAEKFNSLALPESSTYTRFVDSDLINQANALKLLHNYSEAIEKYMEAYRKVPTYHTQ